LASYVASTKGANALFGGNHDFNTHRKSVTIKPKGFSRETLGCISNYRRTRARPKGEHEFMFFS
jgi:hypothetical protein